MINGLNISSYKSQIGNGLHLTGTNLKGRGSDIKCNKKEMLKTKWKRIGYFKIIFLINI